MRTQTSLPFLSVSIEKLEICKIAYRPVNRNRFNLANRRLIVTDLGVLVWSATYKKTHCHLTICDKGVVLVISDIYQDLAL